MLFAKCLMALLAHNAVQLIRFSFFHYCNGIIIKDKKIGSSVYLRIIIIHL